MPKTWTDAEDKRLLITIVQVIGNVGVTTAQWTEIAKRMGGDMTAGAVMQHFNKKLKVTDYDKKDSTASGNSTPARKIATPKSKSATSKRKKSKVDDDDSDNADYLGAKDTPTTKSGFKKARAVYPGPMTPEKDGNIFGVGEDEYNGGFY